MANEFLSFTPYALYETYADKVDDFSAKLLRRPVIEYVNRYLWLKDQFNNNSFKFPFLDIGVGSSWGIGQIKQEFPREKAIGIDLNYNALSEGKSHGVSDLVQSDALKLPFTDGVFNTISTFMMIEQINPNKLRELFQEIHRISKPNGIFALASFNRELFSPRGRYWFTPNQYEYSPEELRKLIEENGWSVQREYGQRFVEPHIYNTQAAMTQTVEDFLKNIPRLKDDRRVRILSPRLLNIFPSIYPYSTVEPRENHSIRIPVINLMICKRI